MKMPIDRWRRITAAAASGKPIEPEDAAWLVGASELYQAQATEGVTLGGALGLEPKAGERPWWVQERHQRQREALQELRRAYLGELNTAAAAREIVRLGHRQLPASDPRKPLLDAARRPKLGMPGPKHLARILGA